jgi:hypothetical protein
MFPLSLLAVSITDAQYDRCSVFEMPLLSVCGKSQCQFSPAFYFILFIFHHKLYMFAYIKLVSIEFFLCHWVCMFWSQYRICLLSTWKSLHVNRQQEKRGQNGDSSTISSIGFGGKGVRL